MGCVCNFRQPRLGCLLHSLESKSNRPRRHRAASYRRRSSSLPEFPGNSQKPGARGRTPPWSPCGGVPARAGRSPRVRPDSPPQPLPARTGFRGLRTFRKRINLLRRTGLPLGNGVSPCLKQVHPDLNGGARPLRRQHPARFAARHSMKALPTSSPSARAGTARPTAPAPVPRTGAGRRQDMASPPSQPRSSWCPWGQRPALRRG